MRFTRHIGIDYSGAQTAERRLKALQVYESRDGGKPDRVSTPTKGAKNWTRLEVAQFCASAIESGEPVIIGIDHAFSFPMSYMQRYGIKSWDQFLDDFMRHWPTADPNTYVDFLRDGNLRTGEASELRLCEQWTAGPKACSSSTCRDRWPNRPMQACPGSYGCMRCTARTPRTPGRSMDSRCRTAGA